ncbi:MAG TPA: DUF4430 domain-containing protein [Candidatus Paceibacterota bacterium]|nr:DUF4430 domain-containing protein [Candidatus Paceibacterota bacterium]
MTRRTLLLIAPLLIVLVLIAAYALKPQAEAPAIPEQAQENTEVPVEASENEEPAPVEDPVFAVAKREAAADMSAALAPATATMIVEGISHPVRAPEGATIEEAMAGLRAEGVLTYKLRSYTGLGSFVTEINGKSDTNEYYWILHINGKKSATGISQTRISSGDVVEWKYEHKY